MPPVRPEVFYLIDRMAHGESYVPKVMPDGSIAQSSEGSESWNATREAETLDDITIVEELASLLDTKLDRDTHSAICFIIGKIALNTQNPRCAPILIDQLRNAKRNWELTNALSALADTPKTASTDIQPLLQLLHHKTKLVVYHAIRALEHTEHPEAEPALLNLAASTDDVDFRAPINAVLGRIGSERSLPMLNACLQSRTRDIKISAQFAIDAINERRHRED